MTLLTWLIFTVGGLIHSLQNARSLKVGMNLMQFGTVTKARIVEVKRYFEILFFQFGYIMTVAFETEDQQSILQKLPGFYSKHKYVKTGLISIVHDPKNPRSCKFHSKWQLIHLPILQIIIGLVFSAFGTYSIIRSNGFW